MSRRRWERTHFIMINLPLWKHFSLARVLLIAFRPRAEYISLHFLDFQRPTLICQCIFNSWTNSHRRNRFSAFKLPAIISPFWCSLNRQVYLLYNHKLNPLGVSHHHSHGRGRQMQTPPMYNRFINTVLTISSTATVGRRR